MNALFLLRFLILPAVATLVFCSCSSTDWPAFRHDALRTASQSQESPLSDPRMRGLKIERQFPPQLDPNIGGFVASPIVYKGRVFIGSRKGYFYALSAEDLKLLWQYPPETCTPPEECPALLSVGLPGCFNPSSSGIASSATIAKIGGVDAVIFAAPDPRIDSRDPDDKGFGNGHLFALNTETGALIWESKGIARMNGCTKDCKKEFHENLGYSSPLVLDDKVYVGVADHCDNPVQQGRVVAVRLADGEIDDMFEYCSTGTCGDGTRGGGVGSPVAGLNDSVFITTGNTRSGDRVEPCPNHGLSLLRLDAATGQVAWKFQPVPWALDADPDWSAAPTVMSTRCGRVVVSTQKDGWTHAVNAKDGSRLWSYPPQKCLPFRCGDGTIHGDTKYMRSGAAWEEKDVYVTMNGGLNLKPGNALGGFRRLHAFNVCESETSNNRLRWLIDLAKYTSRTCASQGVERCLGNPTITRGIVYVGTNAGCLLVIGDPALVQDDGKRCENPDVDSADCERLGYRLVPQPKILAEVKLTGSMVYTEPVLANGSIYAATDNSSRGGGGFVYKLEPITEVSRCVP